MLFAARVSYAEAGQSTLLANAQVGYRFDYRGDNTVITVMLDAPEGVEFAVSAPADSDTPVGRGSRWRDGKVYWVGRFSAPGIYRVTVSNRTPGVVTFRLTVEGDSISGLARLVADASSDASSVANQTLTLNLPPGAGGPAITLRVPAVPPCTHANQIPPVIAFSAKLCANEVYPPLRIAGNNIALFGEAGAVVTSAGRQFAISAEGANIWIDGITIQASADSNDAGAFLCQYDECVFGTTPRTTTRGGILYGGGILLRGSNSVIRNVTVNGGTIGIATVNGRNNLLLDNKLNDLNGWGSFNSGSANSYFAGNTFNRENHACTTPDGFKFPHGCETAGWTCLGCTGNVIARNHCELSGNCFYLSGERGLASNDNRFVANYCAGATDNCFELTFSRGNILLDNIAGADTNTGAGCKYPFWIGGSTVYLGRNTWQCAIGAEQAIRDATQSTSVPTVPIFFEGSTPFSAAPPRVIPRRTHLQ